MGRFLKGVGNAEQGWATSYIAAGSTPSPNRRTPRSPGTERR
jgi:hypothetical protein